MTYIYPEQELLSLNDWSDNDYLENVSCEMIR